MSLLQLSVPMADNASISSSPYWSTPKPVKRFNGMAIASLVFAILGILVVSSALCLSGYLLSVHAPIWVLVPILIPSILAVICGHIGKHRAKTVHGLGESYDMAVVGLVLGYLFGSLYLLIIFSTLWLFFLHLLI